MRVPRSSSQWLGAVLVLAVLAGCGGPAEEDLVAGARSLLPARSEIVHQVRGDCVELAPSPSCVHIYFVANIVSEEDRIADVLRTARASAWVLDTREAFPGGTELRFHTEDATATVSLGTTAEAKRCVRRPSRGCADIVMVEGSYGV